MKAAIDKNIVEAINLASKHPSILKMGVFGSHARGEQTPESDVDIIYDYDDSMMRDMMNCLDEIQNNINQKVDLIAYYLLFNEDMDEYDKQFRDNALKDVIWIYEKNQSY